MKINHGKLLDYRYGLPFLSLLLVACHGFCQGPLQLSVRHTFDGEPLVCGTPSFSTSSGELIGVSRLDYLLSGLALKSVEEGKWVEAGDWHGFISLDKGRHLVSTENSPRGVFSAIRFFIGVDAERDAADPNEVPAGHALNPNVNGLHWGWQGGYVYLALEGHHLQDGEEPRGFSYHLARSPNRMAIEVPLVFDSRKHRTIELEFDLAKVLGRGTDIIVVRDDESTHSREGDELAQRLAANVEQAFSFAGTSSDRYQELTGDVTNGVEGTRPPPGTPYPLRVTQRFPRVALPPDNPLTIEGVQLGERLFHEKRLSKNNERSCASCHDAARALADGESRRVSSGVDGLRGRRNAMPLFNLAWKKAFFWDGRSPNLRHQVLQPIEDPLEMGASLDAVLAMLRGDASYGEMFAAAFGRPEITVDTLAKALEQFLHAQISQEAKFDRAARGEASLTPMEQRGLELFVTEHDPARQLFGADCFHCHGGNLFTNHAFLNNGLDLESGDRGRAEVTGRAADAGKFAVPSLRNVAVTAPYMHDGRMATLEEVIEHYDHGVKRSANLDPNLAKHPASGLGLSPEDKEALVAFLRSLTDDRFLEASHDES